MSGSQDLAGVCGLGACFSVLAAELESPEPDARVTTLSELSSPAAPLVAERVDPKARSRQSKAEDVERSPFVPADYQLVWHEEFNGADLNLDKWTYRSEGRSSDGSGVSVLSRDCVSVDGRGRLRLATRETDGVLQTGMISTNGSFEPLYGYFEARIRFQRQQGHHGAFWLKPRSFGRFPGDPGRSGVEIDVAEFFGSGRDDNGLGVNIYWKDENGELEKRTTRPDLAPVISPTIERGSQREELCDQFHVYSLIWTATRYEFFVDGHRIFATEDGISRQRQPVILSLLSHKWETDKLDREKLDDAMLVDYVRVYQVSSAKLSDSAADSTGSAR